jgi:hypothetical protein
MTERSDRLESIANTIKDYREGEINQPTPGHVDHWVKQFDADVQDPILSELDYVLRKTYINRDKVLAFLGALLEVKELVGADPCSFWRRVNFLNIQGAGSSQREMLQLFGILLAEHCGFSIADCGATEGSFLYLDDASFTGNRILGDLREWITNQSPKGATVNIVTLAFHRYGQYYANREIINAAKKAGKAINLKWWREIEFEDRQFRIDVSDVLRPTELPADERVRAYAEALKYPPKLRKGGSRGEHEFFASDEGRQVLEHELLKAGVFIRDLCPYLNEYQRPLGNMVLDSLGFGSTLVTFRNCPNNTPLAFWADDPWYPLFPRKIN